MKKIHWFKSIWFFDIDDTLIDTARNSIKASAGIKKIFQARFNLDIANSIQDRFNAMYNLMNQGYKVKSADDWDKAIGGKKAFDKLNDRIKGCQMDVVFKYGTYKKWSREIFIKLAADDLHIKISPELIYEAADAYWKTLANFSDPFPQSLKLVNIIKSHSRPVYLLTSSDARFKIRGDKQFEYRPEYSEALKRERIVILRNKGIDYNGLSIGDPEDKPHLDFFLKGIKIAEKDLGIPINVSNAIMIGDSFGGDLQTPKEQMGFGLVVLFQKDKLNTEVVDEHQITTGNLLEVIKFLK